MPFYNTSNNSYIIHIFQMNQSLQFSWIYRGFSRRNHGSNPLLKLWVKHWAPWIVFRPGLASFTGQGHVVARYQACVNSLGDPVYQIFLELWIVVKNV